MRTFLLFVALSLLISCGKDDSSSDVTPISKYTLSVTSTDGGTVSSPGGSYNEGQSVSITATPDSEYVFVNWSNGSTQNPLTITVNQNISLTANFEKRKYPLSISITGSGTVSEEIVSAGKSTTEYTSGSVIRLTANPSDEWIFTGWSGSVSSTDNPLEITVDQSKTITSTFVKRKYPLTINIQGEGTVSEEIISSGRTATEYNSGSVIRLTANPSDEWVFEQWTGSVTETTQEITITLDEPKTVNAIFSFICYEFDQVNLADISQETFKFQHPKYFDQLYEYPHRYGIGYGIEIISLDYNKDGFLDIIMTDQREYCEDCRSYFQFYTGDCEGNLTIDEINTNKFLGLVHSRKILIGDYNNDSFPDVFNIGHGWDYPPFPGEYPVMLLSSPSGEFTERRLYEFSAFNHGGASGDWDNDGDLDIFLATTSNDAHEHSFMHLINDGTGNFTENHDLDDFTNNLTNYFHNLELYDINKDGFLDLIFMSANPHSSTDSNTDRNNLGTVILYGNGEDFTGTIKDIPDVEGWDDVYDIDFFDLDGNGTEEIIVNRLPGNNEFAWYVQIVELLSDEYVDATDKFIENYYSDSGESFWNAYLEIRDYDNDGVVELRNNVPKEVEELNLEFCSEGCVQYHEWELINGRLIKVD